MFQKNFKYAGLKYIFQKMEIAPVELLNQQAGSSGVFDSDMHDVADTALKKALDIKGDPLIPAEIKALILRNISDCRHIKDFCLDRRYAQICTQHHVLRNFIRKRRWRLDPNNFTWQDFDRECNYYSNFLQYDGDLSPELYDQRMAYVALIENFVSNIYDEVINFQFTQENPYNYSMLHLQRDRFCNNIANNIHNVVNASFEIILGKIDITGMYISGTPNPEDLDDGDGGYVIWIKEDGEVIEEYVFNDHKYMIMVYSDYHGDYGANYIVYHISQSMYPMFTTGGADARISTIRKITLLLIHTISVGISNWRQQIQFQNLSEEEKNFETDPVLYQFKEPSLLALNN